MGAGIGTLVCYGLLTVLALYFLCKRARITPNLVGLFLKPFLAGGICVTAAYFVQLFAAKVISGKIATCIAIVVAAAVYVVCMLWFKALNRGDIMMLPKGEKIAKILEMCIRDRYNGKQVLSIFIRDMKPAGVNYGALIEGEWLYEKGKRKEPL